jgi:hypothetical protein
MKIQQRPHFGLQRWLIAFALLVRNKCAPVDDDLNRLLCGHRDVHMGADWLLASLWWISPGFNGVT